MVRSPGNAIQEYALIGALAILACMGVLLSLGGSLNSLMLGLKQDMHSHREVTVQVKQPRDFQSVPGIIAETSAPPQTGGMAQEENPLIQRNLATKLQTLGANGTTELLANQIAELAKSLYEQGEITEAQRNTLLTLANKGHEMAQVERMLEDYVAMAGENRQQFNNMKIEFQGKQYTPMELSKLIGINRVQPETIKDFFREARDTGSLLADFQSLYLEAEKNGSMQVPAIKSLVTSAASQIIITGELMEHSYYKYHDGTYDDVASMKERIVSKATNVNSWQICKSGNGLDDGTLCQ